MSWVKPQEAIIKITVDAATFNEHDFSGAGLVARDARGELIQAKIVGLQGVYSVEMAEVMTIKEALSWIKHKSWQQVEVEFDCLVAVQALIRSKVLDQIVEDCGGMLQELNKTSLFFIKRLLIRRLTRVG